MPPLSPWPQASYRVGVLLVTTMPLPPPLPLLPALTGRDCSKPVPLTPAVMPASTPLGASGAAPHASLASPGAAPTTRGRPAAPNHEDGPGPDAEEERGPEAGRPVLPRLQRTAPLPSASSRHP